MGFIRISLLHFTRFKFFIVQLLHEIFNGTPIRLIGIRVDNLCMKDEVQLSLFDVEIDEKQGKIDKVLDGLKNKYGYNVISKAGEMNVSRLIK